MNVQYGKLALTLSINAVIMVLVGYSMIERIDDLYANRNAVYMVIMMVAPMAITMLIVMRSMFPNHRLNAILHGGLALSFLGALVLTRTQAGVGDQQLLRSMIPHHSSAIVMCEQASLRDPEVIALCDFIVRTQHEEIAQMRAILARNQQAPPRAAR